MVLSHQPPSPSLWLIMGPDSLKFGTGSELSNLIILRAAIPQSGITLFSTRDAGYGCLVRRKSWRSPEEGEGMSSDLSAAWKEWAELSAPALRALGLWAGKLSVLWPETTVQKVTERHILQAQPWAVLEKSQPQDQNSFDPFPSSTKLLASSDSGRHQKCINAPYFFIFFN